MTVRNLERLFHPSSVAIVGASIRPRSLGNLVTKNLVATGFAGALYPVNPHHDTVEGLRAFKTISELPAPPDLAVICTPPSTIPGLIGELGARGTRAAIVLTAGLSTNFDTAGKSIQTLMLEAARPYLFRILGPNCLGLLVPGINLNASFSHIPATPGRLAFISQSGALCTAMLDWAESRGIGFSHLVSLGNSADIDFADVIDYLASDTATDSIILYIESITNARKFLSAARAAARNKPIIAIKSGRVAAGARAAMSHTGAMAGADDVYDAAMRRAGILRVQNIDELFDSVETLSHVRKIAGNRLAIMTNGGGPGVLAADTLIEVGGALADLSPDTLAKLDSVLPATWSRGNPVDMIGDATPERFRNVAEILVQAPEIDAVLFTYSPTALADSLEIAKSTVAAFLNSDRPVFANWLGGAAMETARHVFEQAAIPTFDTPERAVCAFAHLVEYQQNQIALLQTPSSMEQTSIDNPALVRRIIDKAIGEGRNLLTEPEAKDVLAAYGIPVVKTMIATSRDEAARCATAIGYPVAVKLLSPDITHKSDVGGVVLDLQNEDEVLAAADAIRERLIQYQPTARITGFSVQEMARRPNGIEVILGATTDPTFGPVILFGHGGTAAETINDRAIGLPPLNSVLARELISRTRIAKLLKGYRDHPPADIEALASILVRLSQLVSDFGEILEIDINPLLVDNTGGCALDARIRVAPAKNADPAQRLAICPYPRKHEEVVLFEGSPLMLRPIRPEDESAHRRLLTEANPEDLRFRFFGYGRGVSHQDIARWTQIDYDREMAFIATRTGPDGVARTLGVVRSVCDPDNIRAEFAILIDSNMHRRGLGQLLMRKMIDYLRQRRIKTLDGQVLMDNGPMLDFVKKFGFTAKPDTGGIYHLLLDLA